MVFVITAFELLIQFLQAYIFTTLTATYIAGSVEAAH
jgi:F-type H+-transporting ATPase subunit a